MAESVWLLPFGKHKGEPLEDVPDSYLNWLLDQEWFEEKFSSKVQIVETEMKFRETYGRHIDG